MRSTVARFFLAPFLIALIGTPTEGCTQSRPLLVISAGNDGADAWWSSYPQLASAFPNEVLVVAGSNRASNGLFDNAKGRSNFGSLVSLAAPGEQMRALNGSDVLKDFGGTSAAAPLVSGVAGLLLAFDPRLTTKTCMISSSRARRLGAELPASSQFSMPTRP